MVTPIDYVLILERNYPNAIFSGSCETYDKIQWKDTIISQPSNVQLESEWSVLEIQLEMESKLKSMSMLAGMDVVAGFRSSALGISYVYDSDPDSQVNLIGLVTKLNGIRNAGYDPSTGQFTIPEPTDYFPVRLNIGDIQKTYTSHTLSQLNKVIQDGAAFKSLILQTFNNLKDQVLACTSVSSVRLISWVSMAQV